MPQFDFSTAMSQVIWLVLVFGILYAVVHLLYPRIGRVVENRKATIAGDLAEATAARDAAEVASRGGSTVLAEARSQALATAAAARERAATALRARLAEADAGLKASADEAAKRLVTQRRQALEALDRDSAALVVALVERVSGLDVPAAEAEAAVRKVAA